jgi:predicted DCC family thiol-disulfide oxidoreductase YuxK
LIEAGRHDYMLFDGDCGICSYSAEVARRMDSKGRFVIEPYQAFPEADLEKFGISYADCSKRMYVISRRGRAHGGAFGINYFLFQRLPWSLLVVLIYILPILLILEIIGYALVAKNRHTLSRWFGLKACLLK